MPADLPAASDVYRNASLSNAGDRGNLLAHPGIELTMDGRRRPMRARPASPAEKAELWPQVVAAYQGYGGYQRRTSRDIPLIICEPR